MICSKKIGLDLKTVTCRGPDRYYKAGYTVRVSQRLSGLPFSLESWIRNFKLKVNRDFLELGRARSANPA